jgi:putative ABC transport system substrate-binding protein
MRRREFITLLGGAAVAWPLAARAQQPAMPVVGFLSSASQETDAFGVTAFRQGLAQTGFVEGRNVAVEYRWAEDHYDRVPALAADLVRRKVAAIFANCPAAPATNAATSTIPIVFQIDGDWVQAGLVTSLNRAGSNLAGVTNLNVELGRKSLELLHELVPTATIIAALINPTNPFAATVTRDLQAAVRTGFRRPFGKTNLTLQMHFLRATEQDIDTAFTTLVQLRSEPLLIGNDPFFNSRSQQLAALALHHRMPTISQYPQFAAAGGLMGYGGSVTDLYRQSGIYVGRILKGEKPADLPVQQSTKVELIINLKTAKALGLTIPLPLLGRADEVIE